MMEVLYCEWRKLRKSAAFGATMGLALLCPILFFIIKMSDNNFEALVTQDWDWTNYLDNEKSLSVLMAGLVLIAVISSYTWVREHGDNTLNVLFTYPVHRLIIISSKLIIIALFLLGYNLVDTLISHMLIMIVKGEWIPGHIIVDNMIKLSLSYLFQVALIPLFFLLSMISKNIILPVVTSIIFTFVIFAWGESSYLNNLPFGGPIFPYLWYDESVKGLSLTQVLLENGAIMVVCLGAIVHQTLRRDVQ